MTFVVVALAAVAVAVLLGRLLASWRGRGPSAFERVTAPRPTPAPPEEPAGLIEARRVVVAATTLGGVHFRLRPALVQVTEARLQDRHGIGLGDPAAAGLVGEPLWSLVRPDAPEPLDRLARGVSPAAVGAALDRWEAL